MSRSRKKTAKHLRACNKENRRPVAKAKAPNRPAKLRQWSNESMVGAMRAVQSGEMGVNRAALDFGVPKTTLKDRISGRVQHVVTSVLPPEDSPHQAVVPPPEDSPPQAVTLPPVVSLPQTISTSIPAPAVNTPRVTSSVTPVSSGGCVAPSRSPLSELLVTPAFTPKRKKADISQCARVLTSVQSIQLLGQKEQKKKEEEEEKARKKLEREKKKIEREQEKLRKQQEREAKKAEQQKKLAEKEQAKKKPVKRRRNDNDPQPVVINVAGPSSASSPKQYPKRRINNGGQVSTTSSDVCAVCCGVYKDDVDEITGDVTADWIQCTDEDCAVWSHVDCLEREARGFICGVCLNTFV